MLYTNFPNGLTSNGVPILGSGDFPNDSPGSHFYVDSANGSDSNDGTSWLTAKQTIWGTTGGYSLLTANKNDVLHLLGSATAYSSAAVGTWAKDYTHMVGHTAPILTGGRVRLTNTVATATAGEWTISGTGCVFKNIHWQWGDSATATSVVGVAISGNGRNSFINCQFEGPIDATVAGGTAIRVVTITSSQDNWFFNCEFGARTILSNSAAGALVSFNGSNNTGNGFVGCLFSMYNSTTTSAAINFISGAVPTSGFTLFRGCTFMNHTAVAVADVIRNTSVANGMVLLDQSSLCGLGTTVWATNLLTNIFTIGPAGNKAGGIAVVQT